MLPLPRTSIMLFPSKSGIVNMVTAPPEKKLSKTALNRSPEGCLAHVLLTCIVAICRHTPVRAPHPGRASIHVSPLSIVLPSCARCAFARPPHPNIENDASADWESLPGSCWGRGARITSFCRASSRPSFWAFPRPPWVCVNAFGVSSASCHRKSRPPIPEALIHRPTSAPRKSGPPPASHNLGARTRVCLIGGVAVRASDIQLYDHSTMESLARTAYTFEPEWGLNPSTPPTGQPSIHRYPNLPSSAMFTLHAHARSYKI